MIIDKKIKVHQNNCFVCGSSIKVSYELTSVDGPDEWEEVKFYAPIIHCDECGHDIMASEYDKIEDEAIDMSRKLFREKAEKKFRAFLNRKQ